MSRRIHFSRLLDIISGSAVAAVSDKRNKSDLQKDFDIARLETKKLRSLIDSHLPTFYVVDLDTIVYALVSSLGANYFSGNEDYVVSKLITNKQVLYAGLLKTLSESLVKELPSHSFQDVLTKLNHEYEILLDLLATRKTYRGYRNAATNFGFSMRSILNKYGVFIAKDGRSLVNNLGTNSYIVVAPSFSAATKKVNTILSAAVKSYYKESMELELKNYDAKDTNNTFGIGNFINAGHTAATTTSQDGVAAALGINMPYAQEVQYLLSSDPKSVGLDTEISDLYMNSGYSIEFNQNFAPQAKTLLDMQFSFVISMPSKFNTATLRTQEVRRIKEYLGTTVLPEIKEYALKKFAGGLLPVGEVSASPTLFEYYNNLVMAAINGKPLPKLHKKNKAEKTGPNIKIPVILKGSKSKGSTIKIKAKSGGVNISAPKAVRAKAAAPQTYSLAGLQSILTATLNRRIKENMGSGDRKDILNLRSGRFAESVKVERLSESRAGMITAFYSYMRNPYATFSEGGRQQYPRSRDPKLLISKTIREIAAEQAYTRMRAVLV